MSTLTQLSRQLDNAVRALGAELAKTPHENGFEFTVTIGKSYRENPIKIAYAVGQHYGSKTIGNDADAVVTEWRRREGWNDAHEPIELLEAPKGWDKAETTNEDEIPF